VQVTNALLIYIGVNDVSEVRIRWLGHSLHAELNIAVRQNLSVEKGHQIANSVRHELLHQLRYLATATIHIDPANASGEKHHRIDEHSHDDLRLIRIDYGLRF
jgi:divalent metal cation (Fe/Co/Zn/Cd) transporter